MKALVLFLWSLGLGALVVMSPIPAAAGGPCGGNPSTSGNRLVRSVVPLIQGTNPPFPLDSIPTSNGQIVYFTADGLGVFRVSAGGGSATALATGAPFVEPMGVELSRDDQTVYVADPEAAAAHGIGQIFAVSAAGGGSHALVGAAGTAPRGLASVLESGKDVLYYTGQDPTDQQPAVFRLPAARDSVRTIVYKGSPLVTPDGLTVSRTGTIYVTDGAAAGPGCGKVFKIANGTVSTIVDGAILGAPAGIALTFDETALLVSAERSAPDRSDEVLIVSLSSHEITSATKVVSQNKGDAGGLHRARGSDLFSWADFGRRGRATLAQSSNALASARQGQVWLVTLR